MSLPIGCHVEPASSRTPADAPNSPTSGAPPGGVTSAIALAAPGEFSSLHAPAHRATCAWPDSLHATSGAPPGSSAIAAEPTSAAPSTEPSACHVFATSAPTATRRAPGAPTSHAAYTVPSGATASSGADRATPRSTGTALHAAATNASSIGAVCALPARSATEPVRSSSMLPMPRTLPASVTSSVLGGSNASWAGTTVPATCAVTVSAMLAPSSGSSNVIRIGAWSHTLLPVAGETAAS